MADNMINLQSILVAISSCKIPVINHDKILPVGISFNSKYVVLIDDMFARKNSFFFIFQRIKVISPGSRLVDKKKITNERSSRLHNAT